MRPSLTIFILSKRSQFSTKFLYILLTLPTEPTFNLIICYSFIPSKVIEFVPPAIRSRQKSSMLHDSISFCPSTSQKSSVTLVRVLYSMSTTFSATQGIENWNRFKLPGRWQGCGTSSKFLILKESPSILITAALFLYTSQQFGAEKMVITEGNYCGFSQQWIL